MQTPEEMVLDFKGMFQQISEAQDEMQYKIILIEWHDNWKGSTTKKETLMKYSKL